MMKIYNLHSWQVDIAQAKKIQLRLSKEVVTEGLETEPHLIGGVDISLRGSQGRGLGAVVVLSYPGLELVEVKTAEGELKIPYIPGLLSFRECPVILAACQKLNNTPDLILVDGQGIAHPRRFGLASHLGLFLDTPAIGCAKSVLCGRHEPLGESVGAYAELIDGGEVIGAALRTRVGVKPIYVSVGHRISLTSALFWVGRCCRNYRLPEPTRLAHLAAGGNLVSAANRQARLFQ